jgi:hypothetical protein
MRTEGWETRLVEAVDRHSALPFVYGKSDCLMMALDCARAVDPALKLNLPKYNDHAGAVKALVKRGFKDVGEALASEFDECLPIEAHRGDLGIVASEDSTTAVVFVGAYAVGKDHRGSLHVPRSSVKRAFRVP